MKNYIKDNTKVRVLNLVIIISMAIAIVTFIMFALTGKEVPGLSSIALSFGLFALAANCKEAEKEDPQVVRKKDRIIYMTVGVLSLVVGVARIVLVII